MRELMEKYRDLPMDFADAALVRVAERDSLTRVFTLDRKHVSIYRPGRGRRFSIVPL
jgi:predicted nucleic acid-binding protein